MPIRASALRSLGAHLNVFALESHIDDIAHQLGVDPLNYRLSQLSDPRGIAVLEKVAAMSDWGNPPIGESSGRGLGFARYKNSGAWCAVVADITAEETVRVDRLWIAVDVGAVITRDGVLNQIEGGAIQSVSWTLKEEVLFADGRVTSNDWEAYPILRFSEVPPIQIEIIDRPDQPSLGSGECSMGPTAAALGNALFDAIGVRVRNLPLSPEHIVTAMDE
jgi:CO/xanthine dehydrogenase Mo-binding subunit